MKMFRARSGSFREGGTLKPLGQKGSKRLFHLFHLFHPFKEMYREGKQNETARATFLFSPPIENLAKKGGSPGTRVQPLGREGLPMFRTLEQAGTGPEQRPERARS